MDEKQPRIVGAKVRYPSDIGHVIRNARISRGITQGRLAAEAGVSRPWLSKVENGKSAAEIGLVLKVLRILDLELTATERPPADFDVDEFLASLAEPAFVPGLA